MSSDVKETSLEEELAKNKEKEAVIQSKNELLEALNKDFATSTTQVYINSLDKEYAFSEISAKDQKSLTRIMANNEHRKDIIYDAQCALINKAALDKTFDVYRLKEFDRIKLLITLYQENMFQNEVKFTCEECGTDNKYKVDFTNAITRLDEYKLEVKEFDYESRNFKYHFVLEYPSVATVSAFHKSYYSKVGNRITKGNAKAQDAMNNLEYINLFIKSVKFENIHTGATRFIDFTNYKVSDIDEIISAFPQDVLYNETGILKFIVNEYITPLNDSFDKHTCVNCGAVHEKGNNTESFF